MSMRLKKASSFKPKGLGKRGPSAPASSARPSVERQSQTPAPTTESQSQNSASSTRPTEVITIPEEEEEEVYVEARQDSSTSIPTPPSTEPSIYSPIVADLSSVNAASLKRKSEDSATINEPVVQKRVRLDSITSPLAENDSETREEATLQQSEAVERSVSRIDHNGPVTQPGHTFQPVSSNAALDHPIHPLSSQGHQDNPASIYPDPELSSSRLSNITNTTIETPAVADPHVAQVVPTSTYNPDGTLSTTADSGPNASSSANGMVNEINSHLASVESTAHTAKKRRGPAKHPRKRKSTVILADDDRPDDSLGDMRTAIEENLERRRSSKKKVRKTGEKRKKKSKENAEIEENEMLEKKRRRRGVTPEGAENEEVDPTVMTMGELCKEMNIGKPFSRAEEIKKRDEARKEAKKEQLRLRVLRGIVGSEVGGASPTPEVTDHDTQVQDHREEEPQAANHTTVRVNFGPDGRIVYDDQAFQLDLHQQARDNDGAQAAVEENDFSRLVTSASRGKRTSVLNWGVNDTKVFYQMLNSFGQDFDLLALSFGGAVQRRQVKLKAEWEQKHNPRKFQKAIRGLLTTEEVELAGDYQAKVEQSMGYKLENLEDIELELKEHAEKFAQEEAAKIEAKAEDKRKKTEAIRNASRRAKGVLEAQDEPEPEEVQVEQEDHEAEPEFDAQGREKPVYVWTRPNKAPKAKRSKKNMNPHSSSNTGHAEIVGDVIPSIES